MSGPDPYRVLARKYRPTTFEALIGQEALVRTLTNAIAAGRIAQAFILTGVRGVGKTTTARLIARGLNCTGPDGQGKETPAPCGACDNCIAIAGDRHPDVLEMDAASRTGIGDIREIIEAVRYGPVLGRYKIYIIDEVHMLSTAAFNGLLKTLEEPPPFVKFIFATTEIRRVPVTVLSRCQRFDLPRVALATLSAHLIDIAAREEAEVDPAAIQLIARAAEGSVRDALSLLDQAIAHGAGKVGADAVRDMLGLADRGEIFALFDHLMHGRIGEALDIGARLYDRGADPAVIAQDLLDVTHWVTRVKVTPAVADDPGLPEEERRRGRALAESLPMTGLSRAWQMLMKGLTEVRMAPQPMQALEMSLIRMAYAADLPPPEEVLRGLRGEGAPVGAARAAAPAAAAPAAPSGQARAVPAAPADAPRADSPLPGPAAARPAAQPGPSAAGPPPDLPPWEAYPQAGEADAPAWNAGQEDAGQEDEAEALEPLPASFDALVAMFEAHRQMRLAAALHHHAHLVSYAPGRLELRLEPEAPTDLAGRMTQHLRAWTGQQWLVTLSSADGAPTLAVRDATAAAARKAEAAGHPLVQAVLEGFPGAELVDVRQLPPLTGGAELGGMDPEGREPGWADPDGGDSDGGSDESSQHGGPGPGRAEHEGHHDEEPGRHDEAGAGHAGKNAGDAGRA